MSKFTEYLEEIKEKKENNVNKILTYLLSKSREIQSFPELIDKLSEIKLKISKIKFSKTGEKILTNQEEKLLVQKAISIFEKDLSIFIKNNISKKTLSEYHEILSDNYKNFPKTSKILSKLNFTNSEIKDIFKTSYEISSNRDGVGGYDFYPSFIDGIKKVIIYKQIRQNKNKNLKLVEKIYKKIIGKELKIK